MAVAGLLLVSGAQGSSTTAPRAGRRLAAPPTRFGHKGGIVLSRRPRVFSHTASHPAPSSPGGTSGTGLGSGNLSYHGGPVLRQITVHAIFWVPSGYSVSANYESLIDGFFQNVAGASGRSDNDYAVGAQYGDASGPGTYKLSFGSSVVDTDPFPASSCSDGPLAVCLTDAQLQAEIDKVVAGRGWQAGMSNEFFIFTPPPVGSCFDSSSSTCAYSYYCAYHGSFTSSLGNGTVVYANQPYAAQPAAPHACDTGERPNGDDADPTINLISHEEIESITDPLLNAWYDAAGFEIADKCNWNFGQPLGSTGGSGTNTDYDEQIGPGRYYLQQEWSNQTFDPSSGEQGTCVQRDMPQLVLTGTGDGKVSGSSGLTCNSVTCDLSADVGATLALTAQPASGSSFLGWAGACSGTSGCSVTVTPTTSVIARFHTAGLPGGWAQEPLAPPAGTDPLPQGSDPDWSFYRVAESASGGERAFTIYHPPVGFCAFASADTGGIFLERRTNTGWVADGKLTAPAVTSTAFAYWPNCFEFGAEISLSADGSTLLASQDMAGFGGGYLCAAFVYQREAGGWERAATLFPPGIGAAGSPTSDGCDYFGINSVLSQGGTRAAVLSAGRVDVYLRGPSGWSREQHLLLPSSDGCGAGIASARLAISGDGSRLLVGAPECTVNGASLAGRVYDYERAGSSWSLAQTIDTPEPIHNDLFGEGVALSRDGNTAAITIVDGDGLPDSAGAVWVYEHSPGGWEQRVRLAAAVPDSAAYMTCPQLSGDGSTIFCSAFEGVGFDPSQGSIYAFQRPGPSWVSAPLPLRLFAGDGHAQDHLGAANSFASTGFWPTGLAVSPGGGDIATTIAAQNVGLDGNDVVGYEFTTGPVVRSFTPAQASAGTQVTITGANFTDATAVSFQGVAATSFTVDSPTEITATVPPAATVGTIGVTTAKGRGWSSGNFRPLPSIESFAPSVGIAGTRVTIAGANLLGTTAVEFGGVPASSFTVASPTLVTAVVPPTAATGVITVVTPGGSSSSSWPFLLRPVIASLVPLKATAGTPVRVKGTNLGGAATVWLAGRKLRFLRRSPSSLVVSIPKLARGGHLIVDAPTGRAVSPQKFQPEPSITSVEPHSVRPGARVTITGGNLGGTFLVRVDGRRAHLHVVTPTLVVATIPRRARTGRLTVWTWGGTLTRRIVIRGRPRS